LRFNQARVAVEPFAERELARCVGRAHYTGRNLRRILQAQVLHLAARDLEHLELEYDFGLGEVLGRDQLLGEPYRLRRVAHHQQVQPLIHKHVAGLDHRLDEIERLLDVGIAEVKAFHHQFLVVARLVGQIRVDQDGVLVEHLLLELVGHQQEVHRILYGGVANVDSRPQVWPHVAVRTRS